MHFYRPILIDLCLCSSQNDSCRDREHNVLTGNLRTQPSKCDMNLGQDARLDYSCARRYCRSFVVPS